MLINHAPEYSVLNRPSDWKNPRPGLDPGHKLHWWGVGGGGVKYNPGSSVWEINELKDSSDDHSELNLIQEFYIRRKFTKNQPPQASDRLKL